MKLYLTSQQEIISLDTTWYSLDTEVIIAKKQIFTTIGEINRLWLEVIWKRLSPETKKVISG